MCDYSSCEVLASVLAPGSPKVLQFHNISLHQGAENEVNVTGCASFIHYCPGNGVGTNCARS